MPEKMAWSTRVILIFVTIAFVATAATIMDQVLPILSFRIPVSETVEVRVLVYDRENGALKRIAVNAKWVANNMKAMGVGAF